MSTCSTRQVGGVLVRSNRVVADGINGNLPKTKHCMDDGCPRCKDRKEGKVSSGTGFNRCVCVHIEQNIIGYCAKSGTSSNDTVLYLPFEPCVDCAKLVITAGVKEIVWPQDIYWPEDGRDVKFQMIKDSGIKTRSFECSCEEKYASAEVKLFDSI